MNLLLLARNKFTHATAQHACINFTRYLIFLSWIPWTMNTRPCDYFPCEMVTTCPDQCIFMTEIISYVCSILCFKAVFFFSPIIIIVYFVFSFKCVLFPVYVMRHSFLNMHPNAEYDILENDKIRKFEIKRKMYNLKMRGSI